MRLTIIFCITLVSICLKAQITLGLSKPEIVFQNGSAYQNVSANGEAGICYTKNNQSRSSGKYDTQTTYYFNGKGKCDAILINEPDTEASKWIDSFNSKYGKSEKTEEMKERVNGRTSAKELVQTSGLKWIDKPNKCLITLSIAHTYVSGLFIRYTAID